jgi:pyruvate ferredoxin oxidoreductase beta subunit
MDTFTIYVPRLLDKKEYLAPGHRGCTGCGEVLAMRLVLKALGRNVIVVNATGCMEIITSPAPFTSWRVPWIHTLFENTAAVASGVDAAQNILARKGLNKGERPKVVAMGGDGATADIGLQALSGALERGTNFMYVCYDNEGYMNTGVQRSGTTPFGASTTTSPAGSASMGQTTWKKNMPAIAAAHNVPYVATASPSYPFDLVAKIRKAATIKGPAYIHVFSVCPTGWRSPADLSIRLGRLAVESGMFPLYEIENGKYNLNMDFKKLRPVMDYIKGQGRYRHLPQPMLDKIQAGVDAEWNRLKALTARNG